MIDKHRHAEAADSLGPRPQCKPGFQVHKVDLDAGTKTIRNLKQLKDKPFVTRLVGQNGEIFEINHGML